jgi:hypothetical protein
MKKRLSKALFVEEKTHERIHKLKLGLKKKGIRDIDGVINELIDSYKEVNKRK